MASPKPTKPTTARPTYPKKQLSRKYYFATHRVWWLDGLRRGTGLFTASELTRCGTLDVSRHIDDELLTLDYWVVWKYSHGDYYSSQTLRRITCVPMTIKWRLERIRFGREANGGAAGDTTRYGCLNVTKLIANSTRRWVSMRRLWAAVFCT